MSPLDLPAPRERQDILKAVEAALRHFGSLELDGGALAQVRFHDAINL